MSAGQTLKGGFKMLFQQFSGLIFVHKNYSQVDQVTLEMRGMKNFQKNNSSNVMFQFPERANVEIGDVIQQKSGVDLWKVVETEDYISGDVYVKFEAKVMKLNSVQSHKATPTSTSVVIHGDNYGGVLVSSPNAVQTITNEQQILNESIAKLRRLSEDLEVDVLTKEDLTLALERIQQLAVKPKSPSICQKIQEKIVEINGIFEASTVIAANAAPYLALISKTFGVP